MLTLPADVAERHAALIDTIDGIVERHGKDRSSLLPVLQDVRTELGEISDVAMQVVADRLAVAPTEVQGVVTFYAFLGTGRQGRHAIRLCRTLSCAMAGAEAVAEAFEEALSIRDGTSTTTSAGAVTFERVNCIGLCDAPPAALVDDAPVGLLTVNLARAVAIQLTRAEGSA